MAAVKKVLMWQGWQHESEAWILHWGEDSPCKKHNAHTDFAPLSPDVGRFAGKHQSLNFVLDEIWLIKPALEGCCEIAMYSCCWVPPAVSPLHTQCFWLQQGWFASFASIKEENPCNIFRLDTVLAQEIAQGGSFPPLQHPLQKGCSWEMSCPPSISNSDKERLQKRCFKTQFSWKIQEDLGGSPISFSTQTLKEKEVEVAQSRLAKPYKWLGVISLRHVYFFITAGVEDVSHWRSGPWASAGCLPVKWQLLECVVGSVGVLDWWWCDSQPSASHFLVQVTTFTEWDEVRKYRHHAEPSKPHLQP